MIYVSFCILPVSNVSFGVPAVKWHHYNKQGIFFMLQKSSSVVRFARFMRSHYTSLIRKWLRFALCVLCTLAIYSRTVCTFEKQPTQRVASRFATLVLLHKAALCCCTIVMCFKSANAARWLISGTERKNKSVANKFSVKNFTIQLKVLKNFN